MNDVAELKRFVTVHAHAMKLPAARYQPVFDRITGDEDGAAGSWAREWRLRADDLLSQGDFLTACRYYNIARFPFVDGPSRQLALDGCVRAFDSWAAGHPEFEPLELSLPGGRMRCWTTGLSRTQRRPLLVLMGGIVSVKEQWAPVLAQVRKQGMAGVVAEMPGVGENTLRYSADSASLFSAILDAVADRADVDDSYALALSFSGHLALRCALTDRRIRGVVTAGAPISEFFTDAEWQRRVPRITMDTIAHLSGVKADALADHLRPWALTGAELSGVDIPVAYLVSRRYEIIPRGEVDLLRRHVPDLSVLANDDVHGSPAHTVESGLWSVLQVLRMRGIGGPKTWAMGGVLALLRARHRRTGTRS
jgi:pimeloyl-ACP methyl ester carboxylesterase